MTDAGERDELILDHVRRYHLTTDEVLGTLFFQEASVNAARKVTGRLVREGKLRRCRLYESRKYYLLTPRAAEALGEHRSITRPFNYQGLVNAYGVLWFCASNGLDKFTAREFMEQFPDLHRRGTRASNYYVDRAEDTRRLGFIQVDSGRSAEKLIRKIRKIVSRAYGVPDFAKLIQSGRFLIAVVAPSAGKTADIERALKEEPASPVRYRVVTIPELGHLLVNRPEEKEIPVPREDPTQDGPDARRGTRAGGGPKEA